MIGLYTSDVLAGREIAEWVKTPLCLFDPADLPAVFLEGGGREILPVISRQDSSSRPKEDGIRNDIDTFHTV